MKSLPLPFLCLALALSAVQGLHAQDLHIYFNAFTDSVYYMQDGKPLSRPAVRQGANVVLHVENYNNYLYKVQVKNQDKSATLGSGSPLSAITGALGREGTSPLDMIFGGGSPLGSIPGIVGLPNISGFGASEAEQERQTRMELLKKHLSVFDDALGKMETRDRAIASLQAEMQTLFVSRQTQAFIAEELERIRFNPELEPGRIKELAQEYAVQLFGASDPQQITLGKVQAKADAGKRFLSLKRDYETEVTQFAAQIDAAKGAYELLSDPIFDFPESNLGWIKRDGEEALQTAGQNLETYKTNLEVIDAGAKDIQSSDFKELAELRSSYLALMDNSFSKTYRQPASGDRMELQVILTPIDSVNAPGAATQTLAPIEVSVYGGLRINAGIGLGFGQFFRTPQAFFVRDSVIQSSSRDEFMPFLTSFIHFYSPSRSTATLGGSFGVGIPLGGSSGPSLESITFFLGPSLILGRSQRIVLSAGLMGGKVGKLSGGFNVGDRFELSPDFLQTESVYRLGYSLGLSFNLGGN